MKKRWIFLLILLAGIAVFVSRGRSQPVAEPKPGGGNQPVAVLLGSVEQRDVPIWLTGIGNVQASNTVTVRPRVSGSLDTVNFAEGSLVKEGDVLARIDPRPYQSILAQAEAKTVQDQATLANAKLEAARFENLVKQNAVSKQQFDQAEATVAQLSALIQADQAAVQAAQLDLDFTTVRAPISGRTGVRLVDAGNIVTANQGSGLVVVTQLNPISVIFTIPQQHFAALSKNMRPGAPRLKVQALGEDDHLLDEGELELIDNQIDVSTGTLRLKAIFKNDQHTLWPGQFVSARTLVETREKATVAPAEAVQPGIDGEFCYVVKEDQTVEARNVKTGLETNGIVIIEEGLQSGERIVVSGQNKLKPGSKVAPQEKAP